VVATITAVSPGVCVIFTSGPFVLRGISAPPGMVTSARVAS